MPRAVSLPGISRIEQIDQNIRRPRIVEAESDVLPIRISGKAEVQQSELLPVICQIRHADVSVHHIPAVKIFQNAKELCPDPVYFFVRKNFSPLKKPLFQRSPLLKLKDIIVTLPAGLLLCP